VARLNEISGLAGGYPSKSDGYPSGIVEFFCLQSNQQDAGKNPGEIPAQSDYNSGKP